MTFDYVIQPLTEDDLKTLIKQSKMPKSVIPGDMFPELVSRTLNYISLQVKDIYNSIISMKNWPEAWKIEFQTCIPKVSSPTEIGETRNISCTAYLSKVFELFILKEARKFVRLISNQYGGKPGVSTTHFLTNIWHKITSGLEDNRAGVTLAAIDYSKAFNRLQHLECLKALAGLGLPTQLLQVI